MINQRVNLTIFDEEVRLTEVEWRRSLDRSRTLGRWLPRVNDGQSRKGAEWVNRE